MANEWNTEPVTDDLAHVIFPLEVVDNWPPVTAERVWAVPLGEDRYRVVNVPWFVFGVAEDDIVRAVLDKDEQWPHFVEFIEWAGNYVIRLIPTGENTEQHIMDAFAELGITGEAMGGDPLSMVALNVPANADLTSIKELMLAGKADGRWDYEEAAIDDRWRNA